MVIAGAVGGRPTGDEYTCDGRRATGVVVVVDGGGGDKAPTPVEVAAGLSDFRLIETVGGEEAATEDTFDERRIEGL